MAMLLSHSTWGMATVSIDDAIAHCAALGFDGLEVTVTPGWPTDAANLDAAERKRIRRLFDDHEIALPGLAGHTAVLVPDDATLQHNLARFRGYLDLASEWQKPGEQMVVGTTSSGKTGEWEAVKAMLVERFGVLADHAASRGVVIAVEPHVGLAVDTPDQAAWLVEQINSPAFRLLFDISHFNVLGMDMEAVVAQLVPYSAHAHVKDERGIYPQHEFLIPGDGEMDYVKYLKAMARAGYSGFVVTEISKMISNRPGYDPLAAAAQAYRVLSGAFDSAGIARQRVAAGAN